MAQSNRIVISHKMVELEMNSCFSHYELNSLEKCGLEVQFMCHFYVKSMKFNYSQFSNYYICFAALCAAGWCFVFNLMWMNDTAVSYGTSRIGLMKAIAGLNIFDFFLSIR